MIDPAVVFLVLLSAIALGMMYFWPAKPEVVEEELEEPVPEPDPPGIPPFEVDECSGFHIEKPNEHHLIWAPTGQGKTEFMKMLLRDRLEDWQNNKLSVVVIDTKGDLIDDILEAKEFCTKKTIIIDPRDVGHPFNLGFVNFEKTKALPEEEREAVYSGIVDMFITALGSADTEMTTKQRTVFNNVFKLLQVIPDASIITMIDVLREGSQSEYQKYIDRLDDLAQGFFNDLFYKGREFKETKDQVYRRLFAILDNPHLRRAFTDPHPTFDFVDEFEKGSLILINVSTKMLKEQAKAFGGFIMARILHAIEDRPGRMKGKPVLIFADEAYVYLDDNAADIFVRARSANVGIVPVLPTVSTISTTLRDVILENTRTKSVGALSLSNARKVLEHVKEELEPERIKSLGVGEMMTFSQYPLTVYWRAPQLQYFDDTYQEKPISMPGYYAGVYKHHSYSFIGKFEKATTRSTVADRQAVWDRVHELYSVKPRKKITETPEDDNNSSEDDPSVPEYR